MEEKLGINIYVENDWHKNEVKIWAVEITTSKIYAIFPSDSDSGIMTRIEIPEMGPIPGEGRKPLLTLPRFMAKMFFEGIAKYLSDENIKTDNDNLLLGRIEAKDEHLKDMRAIVKKLLKMDNL